ncbi:MAG: hypothetical protein HYU52_04095 [Acidobacteria bacterium]|nr:hypothetical protein [Acidobacteriota bacterium]
MWLGSERGAFVDWLTQQWVKLAGRRADLAAVPWLGGPVGTTTRIGRGYFDDLAREEGLVVANHGGGPRGLILMEALGGPSFDSERVDVAVRAFYERTSEYDFDTWSEWCGFFRPFGWLLAVIFSRRLQQLNMPLSPLDTSGGMVSEVLHLVDRATGSPAQTVWLRELRKTGQVLYAGCYATATLPGHPNPCVKVLFPLPNGNAIVFLRPSVDEEGALTLTSSGRRFGDPGFYFTVHDRNGSVWVKQLRTLRETIRVYPDERGVRADHTLTIWRLVFLRLHYRCSLRVSQPANAGSIAGP